MFFIIWSGKGFLVILSIIIGGIINSLLTSLLGISGKEQMGIIITCISFIIGFIPLWFYGNKINTLRETGYIDKETGEDIYTRNNHTFFWIPLQYWGIIGPILFLIIMISSLI